MFFNPFGESYNVIIEQYIGETLVGSNRLSAPESMLMGQFIGLVEQVAQQRQPMKIVMKRPEEIWDNFEQKQKILWYTIEFKNNLYKT